MVPESNATPITSLPSFPRFSSPVIRPSPVFWFDAKIQIVSSLFNIVCASVVIRDASTFDGTAISRITSAASPLSAFASLTNFSFPVTHTPLPSASISSVILLIKPSPRLMIDSEVASWFKTPIRTLPVAFAMISFTRGYVFSAATSPAL